MFCFYEVREVLSDDKAVLFFNRIIFSIVAVGAKYVAFDAKVVATNAKVVAFDAKFFASNAKVVATDAKICIAYITKTALNNILLITDITFMVYDRTFTIPKHITSIK